MRINQTDDVRDKKQSRIELMRGDGSSAGISASFKAKLIGNRSSEKDAHQPTAAQSVSLERTLAHDASR